MENFFVVAPLSNYEWYWWLQIAIFAIGCPILLILFIIHLSNVISDLCTKKRRSLKSIKTKIKPELNPLYIITTLTNITCIALFTYGSCACIAWMWNYNNCDKLTPSMKISIIIGSIAWLLAKQSMYIFFLFRLHITYKTSIYEYNTKILIFIGIISCISTIICIYGCMFYIEISIKYYPHLPFAAHYDTSYPLWGVLISGGMDNVIGITFIYLFMKPLMVITNGMCCNNTENIDQIMQLYAIGVKSLILTSMSIFTTLCLLLSILLTNTLLLLPIDAVINCVCIMMIAPYYSDEKYYQNLCCLLIKLSEKYEIKKIESKIEIGNSTPVVPHNTPHGSPKNSPTITDENVIVEF